MQGENSYACTPTERQGPTKLKRKLLPPNRKQLAYLAVRLRRFDDLTHRGNSLSSRLRNGMAAETTCEGKPSYTKS
jgi:hypothetical protein